MEKRIRKSGGWAASGSCTIGRRRKKRALLEMDGQKAMVIHPPPRERRRRCPPSAVRGKLERDTRVMQSRGEREREKEEEERRISAWPPSEERSNRCQLGEMREERGDDDDDERRAAAVGTVLIG